MPPPGGSAARGATARKPGAYLTFPDPTPGEATISVAAGA